FLNSLLATLNTREELSEKYGYEVSSQGMSFLGSLSLMRNGRGEASNRFGFGRKHAHGHGHPVVQVNVRSDVNVDHELGDFIAKKPSPIHSNGRSSVSNGSFDSHNES
ncbi:hypothetical protein H0H87_002212, partial [Tephrocybe sp. NHM501043]